MKIFWILLVLGITLHPTIVDAHRSGCHRWHSCPSDSGSYTCGDTGHCSGCPDNQYCEDRKVRTLKVPDPSSHTESTSVPIKSCEGGHWISDNHGGKMIVLENGSKWMVDDIDTIDTSLWLATEEIIVCQSSSKFKGEFYNFFELINTDNNETVGVEKVN